MSNSVKMCQERASKKRTHLAEKCLLLTGDFESLKCTHPIPIVCRMGSPGTTETSCFADGLGDTIQLFATSRSSEARRDH
jgi:hypothetical protein